MPEVTPSATENKYGDKHYAVLINDLLNAIVYTSIKDFDAVFAEFDKLINNIPHIPSTRLANLYELFHNENSYIMPNEEGIVEPEQLAALQQQIKERLNVEKTQLATKAQRKERLNTQKPQNPMPVVIKHFPTKEDLALMEKYEIARTTAQPEFEMCVAAHELLQEIHDYNRDKYHADMTISDHLEYKFHCIYQALGMTHEANLITRHLHAELHLLANIKTLFQASKFTIRQFQTRFEPEIKTYLLDYAKYIFIDLPQDIVSEENLIAYIKCRKLLFAINPYLESETLYQALLLAQRDQETELGNYRNQAIDFLADHCGYFIDHDTSDQEIYYKLLYVLWNIIHITVINDISLYELYSFNPASRQIASNRCSTFNTFINEVTVLPHKILALAPESILFLLDQTDLIRQTCKEAGLTLREFFSLSTENLDLLLSDPDNLQKIFSLLNVKISKKTFLTADLKTLKSFLKQTLTIRELFKLMAAPNKNYEAIAIHLPGLEFISNMGLSAYAFALQQNDAYLTDMITTFTIVRSMNYVNAFLISHGFKLAKPKDESMLTWYNMQTAFLGDNVLNSRNAEGNTPLLVAIAKNDYVAALGLIVNGADIHRTGANGITALELAKSLGFQEVVNDLLLTQKYMDERQIVLHKPY